MSWFFTKPLHWNAYNWSKLPVLLLFTLKQFATSGIEKSWMSLLGPWKTQPWLVFSRTTCDNHLRWHLASSRVQMTSFCPNTIMPSLPPARAVSKMSPESISDLFVHSICTLGCYKKREIVIRYCALGVARPLSVSVVTHSPLKLSNWRQNVGWFHRVVYFEQALRFGPYVSPSIFTVRYLNHNAIYT